MGSLHIFCCAHVRPGVPTVREAQTEFQKAFGSSRGRVHVLTAMTSQTALAGLALPS